MGRSGNDGFQREVEEYGLEVGILLFSLEARLLCGISEARDGLEMLYRSEREI